MTETMKYVEPGNSPLWAVSCYRCGQLGHTGLACGRHYDESNENDFESPSCFKCGGEGHFKRDCPNSSSVRFPENSREASACYRCGEEGHISRECPNSSIISNSQGRDSPTLCYKCNGAGHFARECPNSSQASKRDRDSSTKSHKSRKKNKENSEHNSTPHESNGKTKKKKKKKTHKEEEPQTTPRKPKHRGGWITEEPEEESFQRGKMRRPRSPITPSGYNCECLFYYCIYPPIYSTSSSEYPILVLRRSVCYRFGTVFDFQLYSKNNLPFVSGNFHFLIFRNLCSTIQIL